MFAIASYLCIDASEITWRRQGKQTTFGQMWSACTALSTMLPSMCSAWPQFPFYQNLIELKVHKKQGIESQQKDIFPLFSCAIHKQEQWKQWETKLHPFALHNILKFLLSQINQATAKHRSRLKCHLLGCCGIWEQSYFHTICFFTINYFVTRVYNKMYRENVRWISF